MFIFGELQQVQICFLNHRTCFWTKIFFFNGMQFSIDFLDLDRQIIHSIFKSEKWK